MIGWKNEIKKRMKEAEGESIKELLMMVLNGRLNAGRFVIARRSLTWVKLVKAKNLEKLLKIVYNRRQWQPKHKSNKRFRRNFVAAHIKEKSSRAITLSLIVQIDIKNTTTSQATPHSSRFCDLSSDMVNTAL